ncbi:hypothetical protein [Sphingomonas crocodyli]|uniref:Uncharacterized protein n=1 Tax=Sphingomonas crocodyli TaxID=1979270 RepID=A0A437LWS9_9SPHN|nr:hypothetical protein [Sphingomonas crocodyli]RVT89858.1 hypothetical protein EOD43_21025 [Sphingomonas crocodyli]
MSYELFFREPASGRLIARRALISCDDDQVALREMARMVDSSDVELWDHGRLVAALPAARRGGATMRAGAVSLWDRLKSWIGGAPLKGQTA